MASERAGELHRRIERAAMARRELEHARCVNQRTRGLRLALAIDELESHRDLRGAREMAQLRLEQFDERLAAPLRAIQLAQRSLDRAIARAIRQRAAIGVGGFAGLIDGELSVAQTRPPVRALGGVLARGGGLLAELDQILMEDIVPWVPRAFGVMNEIVSPRVTSYSFDAFSGMASLDRLAVAISA